MIPKSVQKYLDKIGVRPEAVTHKKVFTAYDLAQTTKLKLEGIAKTILVKVEPPYVPLKKLGQGSKYVIAILPASHHLDFAKLKKILKVKKVSIPHEGIMSKLFKVKAGALTPFGPLHKSTPVIIDKALLKSKKIMARSGSFTESLLMKSRDFLKATEGKIAVFAKKVKK